MTKLNNFVVIDIETMGLRPTSEILAVGATHFTQQRVDEATSFYMKVDPLYYSDLPEGLFTTDISTLKWWESQPAHVKEEAFSGDHSLPRVLEGLTDWMEQIRLVGRIDFMPVFMKGIQLDAPVLNHAYKVCKMQVPWHYRELFDSRAYEALFRELVSNVKAANTNSDAPLALHTAVGDSIFQARYLQLIVEQLAAQGLFIEGTEK